MSIGFIELFSLTWHDRCGTESNRLTGPSLADSIHMFPQVWPRSSAAILRGRSRRGGLLMSEATPVDPAPDAPTPDEESLIMTGCRLWKRTQIAHLDRPIPWLWHGYLARGHMALLTGQWKVGKTSLLAALLARMEHGGVLAGRRVEPGRAMVITEESIGPWREGMHKHGIGDAASFAFEPFLRKPLPKQWGMLLDDLTHVHRRRGIDLVVIDPLVSVLPGREECSAQSMTDALRPLRELTARGPG